MVGVPALLNLKMMIRHNIIQNFPFMVEDIEKTEKIFDFGMSILKVITLIQTPKVVVDDFIDIPRELIDKNQELILCVEFMFINQQKLLTTIGKDIGFCGLVTPSKRTE